MIFTCSETDSCLVTLVAKEQCKLFPTVLSTPTSEHVVDFDLSPEKGCYSLASSLIAAPPVDSGVAPCPPRIKVMALAPSQWVRQQTKTTNFSIVPTPGGTFQIFADKDPVYSICITLPEEDITMDILELSEDEQLMEFHIQTLKAYAAITSHSNCILTPIIGQVVDSEQLLQCLRTEGLRFSLLSAYYSLVSSLHLQMEVSLRLTMRGEFIIPLSQCTKSATLFPAAPQKPKEQVYRVAMAPLPGLHPALRNQANMSHNISSTFSQTAVW